MAESKKKLSKEEKDHKLKRLRPMMSLEELDELSKELKSDEDFVEHTLEHAKKVSELGIVTIFGTTSESPRETLKEDGRSFAFFKQPDAVEYLQSLLDAGTINPKPREVMQKGFGRMRDKYLDLKEMEENENSIIREFCEPSFEDICNNIWVNGYNGLTYNTSEDDIPEEAKNTTGVFIPGVIDTQEDYIDFVRRLKDRGKHGLGRAIYDKYEDYEEAIDLINQYKDALYEKYGGKDKFFEAKELGGIFGAYEYFPMLEPKYKKSIRNRRLAKGLSLNPLAYVKDMGKRIREEHEDEFEDMSLDKDIVYYEEAPPKFRDLPDVFQQVYKLDEEGNRAYDTFKNFKSYKEFARDVERRAKFMSPEDIELAYELLEEIAYEEYAELEVDDNGFLDTLNGDESINIALENLAYNKLMSEYEYVKYRPEYSNIHSAQEYADLKMNVEENRKAYTEFVKSQVRLMNGIDEDNISDVDKQQIKTMTDDAANFAADMMYDETFRRRELAKREMNRAADTIAKARGIDRAFGSSKLKEKFREEHRAGDGPIEGYIRQLNSEVKSIVSNAESNAESDLYRNTISTKDIAGGTSYNDYHDNAGLGYDSFNMTPNLLDVGKYAISNIDLAKKMAELSTGVDDASNMFGIRVDADTFLENASKPSKPLATKESMEENMQEVKRRKGLLD